jgi:hypothetical protein
LAEPRPDLSDLVASALPQVGSRRLHSTIMLDIRYHITYLCAIFLMLGFGIIVGEALYPHQARAQTKQLQALRQEANQAIAAQGQFAKSESAIDALRPNLVRGILANKRVILVVTGDYPDAAVSASNALTDAGATVSATVTLTSGWASLNDQDNTSDLHALAAVMTQGTAVNTQNRQLRTNLEAQDLIGVQGDLSRPVLLFVFVGGKSDPNADGSATLDIALSAQINTVTHGATRIVGCETLDAAVSVMQAYQDAGLATVDCIDQPLGALDLPFALSGEVDSYGLTPTAAQLVPASLGGSGAS